MFSLLAIALIYPIAAGIFLYKNKDKLGGEKDEEDQQNSASSPSSSSRLGVPSPTSLTASRQAQQIFQGKYGVLYESYRPGVAWYWNSFVLIRQTLLIGLSIAFQLEYNNRYLAYSYFNLAQYLACHFFSPHRLAWANSTEKIGHLLLLLMTALMGSTTPPIDQSREILVFFLVVPYGIFLVFTVILVRLPFGKAKKFSLAMGLVEKKEMNFQVNIELADGKKFDRGFSVAVEENEIPSSQPSDELSPSINRRGTKSSRQLELTEEDVLQHRLSTVLNPMLRNSTNTNTGNLQMPDWEEKDGQRGRSVSLI